MATILLQSVDTVAKTVTVTVNGNEVTRPLPEHALASQENFDAYMLDYASGLRVEFADPIAPAAISVTPGEEI